MATGDEAVAAGMARMAGSVLANTIETEMMLTRDYIAQRAKRSSPTIDIWVQATAPVHAPGRVWIKTAT